MNHAPIFTRTLAVPRKSAHRGSAGRRPLKSRGYRIRTGAIRVTMALSRLSPSKINGAVSSPICGAMDARPQSVLTWGSVTEAAVKCKVEHRYECRETPEKALPRLRGVYATREAATRGLSTRLECQHRKAKWHRSDRPRACPLAAMERGLSVAGGACSLSPHPSSYIYWCLLLTCIFFSTII